MDTNQTELTNRPSCEWVSPGEERLTQERVDCYLARGRYLQSEFTVRLLAALWKKLKNGSLRTVTALKSAVDKVRGPGGDCDHDASAQQKPGVFCKPETVGRS